MLQKYQTTGKGVAADCRPETQSFNWSNAESLPGGWKFLGGIHRKEDKDAYNIIYINDVYRYVYIYILVCIYIHMVYVYIYIWCIYVNIYTYMYSVCVYKYVYIYNVDILQSMTTLYFALQRDCETHGTVLWLSEYMTIPFDPRSNLKKINQATHVEAHRWESCPPEMLKW